uniref:non-specific serine/threonine protein kinase n=1 Tax=Cajanus cajan TaxID=3821 RepID=A0A151U6A9_CAJCA|nr:Lectin-domain containing receptor kinase A4.2 [Cajanus cajan]
MQYDPSVLMILVLLLWVPSITLSSDNMSMSMSMSLYGDAVLTPNGIALTTTTCSPSTGRAFYSDPIRFHDPLTNATASFSSRFSFSILPSSSGFLGLPSSPLPFLALHFDTTRHRNRLALHLSSLPSLSADASSQGITLTSNKLITAWIHYAHALNLLRVWLSYSTTRPPSPLLSSQLDLSQTLNHFMHVGFTASNGEGSSLHLLHRCHFNTFAYYDDHDHDDSPEDADCFFCYQDHDSSRSDLQTQKRKKIGEMVLGLGGLTAFVVSLLAAMFVVCVFLTKKKEGVREGGQSCRNIHTSNRVPTRLSLSEIKSATMGFNRDRLVGEGASAKVYRGYLPFGGDVAVKRFAREGSGLDCLHNPFATEFATMVGYLRHKNLVQLKGWCCEGNELVLVYEFLPNGSLNKVLHRNFGSCIVLSWRQRLNIVLGVASALTYLHEECERQIIHRDVKTCNIMLDADFNAKLGDFGLAEVYEHSCSTRDATIPAGTMGYLAPEYVYSGVPTAKTDVYSFGVVVLEVATGRKPVEDDGTVVADYVWSLWEKRRLIEAADPRLMGKFDALEMERMLLVGLLCVHPDYEKRPRVREAARILKKEAPLPLLPLSKPRVKIGHICPNDTPEAQNVVVGDWLSTDEAPYLTPRSQFY